MTQGAAAMAGRTCLVTGATSGIGKATATGLARLGTEVALVARDPAKGRATLAEIQAVLRALLRHRLAQRLWQVSEQLTGLRQPA